MALAPAGLPKLAWAGSPLLEVWKGLGCDCCTDLVKHLEGSGCPVKTYGTGNTEARARLGMPVKYATCHTGQVAGYAFGGHVPARDVSRLIMEQPVAVGLAVPGVPRGSPGMDGPAFRGQRDPFNVLAVARDGSASTYQSYR